MALHASNFNYYGEGSEHSSSSSEDYGTFLGEDHEEIQVNEGYGTFQEHREMKVRPVCLLFFFSLLYPPVKK